MPILPDMYPCKPDIFEATYDRAAHVQNPAEIEHVAGDVSKNGAEVNMSTQQPAPAGATPAEAVERIVHLRAYRERRIYVAGPMTGLPEYNFPLFNSTAARLRSEGWHVENPAEHGHVEGAGWADYLRWDISRIATCGAIYLLPGWSNSKGATLEVHIAGVLALEVLLADGAEAPSPQPAPATQKLKEQVCISDINQSAACAVGSVGTTSDAQTTRSTHDAPATQQAASSAVLKAIREANMQLVRTGDNAFMLVPYKVATAHAAGSVPAISDLPPLPDPDLRDVGTKPQEIKDFLNGYATEYARLALAARAPAESVPVVLGDDELVRLGKSPESGLHPWGIGATRADYLRALRAVLAAARAPAESVGRDAERLAWMAGHEKLYVQHVLENGGVGDVDDLRTFIDKQMAANGGNK